MKIQMPGPIAGPGWSGAIESWAPNQVVDVDDANAKAVAWARGWLEMGAVLVEDVAKPAKPPASTQPATRQATRKET